MYKSNIVLKVLAEDIKFSKPKHFRVKLKESLSFGDIVEAATTCHLKRHYLELRNRRR